MIPNTKRDFLRPSIQEISEEEQVRTDNVIYVLPTCQCIMASDILNSVVLFCVFCLLCVMVCT